MKRSVEEEILYNSIKWHLFPDKRKYIEFGNFTKENTANALEIAKSHAMVPFLFDAFTGDFFKDFISEECLKEVKGITRQTTVQNYRLFLLTKYICNELNKSGIETLVLKGIAAAREYPQMLYRKSGDIDLFLVDKQKLGDAVDLLKNCGFLFFDKDQTENHQTVLESPDGIKIEIHTMLVEPFSDSKVNEKISDFEKKIAIYADKAVIMGNEYPVLERGAFAYTLLLHALQHFMRAGFGLKLLCDMAVIFGNGLNEKEKETYLSLVSESRLIGFSEIILSVCVYYLGLDKENVPHSICEIEKCEEFVDDVLEAEEFGRSNVNRMAIMSDTSLIGYFKEFHHQMKLSFPKASKIFIIIPVLWIITLTRFLRNNKKVRNTTAREILKTSGKRSKMAKEFEIFKR